MTSLSYLSFLDSSSFLLLLLLLIFVVIAATTVESNRLAAIHAWIRLAGPGGPRTSFVSSRSRLALDRKRPQSFEFLPRETRRGFVFELFEKGFLRRNPVGRKRLGRDCERCDRTENAVQENILRLSQSMEASSKR